MNRENRNIGGREQTVVINRGPDVNNIEKATGKKLTAVSVAEVQRRTIIPPTVRREKERAPAAQEKPKPAQPVVAAPELPNKPAPSDKTLRPTKPEITVPKTPPLREKPVSPPPEKKVVPPPSQPNMPPSVPPGNVERPASPPPEKKVAPPQSQPNEVRPNRPSNVPAVNEKKQNPSQDKEKAKEEKPKDRDKDMPK